MNVFFKKPSHQNTMNDGFLNVIQDLIEATGKTNKAINILSVEIDKLISRVEAVESKLNVAKDDIANVKMKNREMAHSLVCVEDLYHCLSQKLAMINHREDSMTICD